LDVRLGRSGLSNDQGKTKMRKLLLSLLAVASLAAAGAVADLARPAAAASQTVTITKTGYNPTAVSIQVGDSVLFANSDTIAHTVTFKTTTGVKCPATPLVVQAGQSASCTFSTAGKFSFSDPAGKGKNFRGTVTVATPLGTTLAVTPKTLAYGRKVTISGALTSKQAGQPLQVQALQCGATAPTKLANVTTTTGGAFTYQAQPLKNTAYSVQSKGLTSTSVSTSVMPRLRLAKVGRHKYTLMISAGDSFAGKYATFQRFRKSTHRWVKVKRVLLQANTTGVAPTVITSAAFRSGIRAGVRIRATLGAKQVGSCYLAGRSNTIRS
jgi:plastocyanin